MNIHKMTLTNEVEKKKGQGAAKGKSFNGLSPVFSLAVGIRSIPSFLHLSYSLLKGLLCTGLHDKGDNTAHTHRRVVCNTCLRDRCVKRPNSRGIPSRHTNTKKNAEESAASSPSLTLSKQRNRCPSPPLSPSPILLCLSWVHPFDRAWTPFLLASSYKERSTLGPHPAVEAPYAGQARRAKQRAREPGAAAAHRTLPRSVTPARERCRRSPPTSPATFTKASSEIRRIVVRVPYLRRLSRLLYSTDEKTTASYWFTLNVGAAQPFSYLVSHSPEDHVTSATPTDGEASTKNSLAV